MVKVDKDKLLSGTMSGFIKTAAAQPGKVLEGARELPLDLVDPNPRNARKNYEDREDMTELTDSIKEQGVIQPVIVRKIGERYVIVAGDRRRLASIRAGKRTIPA